METIVQIAQLVLALSILVGIHEAGHMIAAKYFGMKVEKFFIGFPPKIFGFKISTSGIAVLMISINIASL